MEENMKHLIKLLLVSALTLPLTAGENQQAAKPATAGPPSTANAAEPASPVGGKKLGPELIPAEVRQVERFSDLYEEYAQQANEAQARLKVLQEMQQKLMTDFNNFQAAAIAARGYKNGEAVLDLQQRKVTPVPARTDKPSVPSK
jgi:DNA-binding transcriptional regulator YdaS (Cro superfamily)